MTGYIPRDTVPIHDTAPSETEPEVTLKPCGCDPSIDQTCPICYRPPVQHDSQIPKHEQPCRSNSERGNILQEAIKVTGGDRQAIYGHPLENWSRTVAIFKAMTGHDLTPGEGVKFAIAMKLARLQQTPGHRDSKVDLAGYAWVLDEVEAA